MHVIGFFGTEGASRLDGLLAASGREERALDILVTGLAIASGTTALHDVTEAPERLECGYQTDAYWTTRKVLQTIGERLDEERLARVEEAVLGVGDAYGRWPRARSLRPNRLSGLGPHEIGVRLVTGINRESVNIATRRYWGIGQETDPGRGRAEAARGAAQAVAS